MKKTDLYYTTLNDSEINLILNRAIAAQQTNRVSRNALIRYKLAREPFGAVSALAFLDHISTRLQKDSTGFLAVTKALQHLRASNIISPYTPEPITLTVVEQIRSNKKPKHIRLAELILARSLADDEEASLDSLYNMLQKDMKAYVDKLLESPEISEKDRAAAPNLTDFSDPEYILYCFASGLGRLPTPHEIYIWAHEWLNVHYTRSEAIQAISKSSHPLHADNYLVLKLFGRGRLLAKSAQSPAHHNATIMGTTEVFGYEDWCKRKEEIAAILPRPVAPAAQNISMPNSFYAKHILPESQEPTVSIITSLYNGDQYISSFLENITSLKDFNHFELIIIDSDSPGNERVTIDEYMQKFPNIVYHRCPTRIGIYEAWNIGVNLSRGKYLTNANLDDLRAKEGLALQAAALDRLPSFDVVYGDFYYFFEPNPSWELVEAVNIRSRLSCLSPAILLTQNYPHCAPMWRKDLHIEAGMFDERYFSAADWEFWLRCLKLAKKFLYIPIPLSAYYQNPAGLSTSSETKGIEEVSTIYEEHFTGLLRDSAPEILMGRDELMAKHPCSKHLEPRSHLLQSFVEAMRLEKSTHQSAYFAEVA